MYLKHTMKLIYIKTFVLKLRVFTLIVKRGLQLKHRGIEMPYIQYIQYMRWLRVCHSSEFNGI